MKKNIQPPPHPKKKINYHGSWNPNLQKKIIQKEKKHKIPKFPWSMSAKSDTYLPGLIYNQVRIFLNHL